MNSIYVVGDIHGCLDKLTTLYGRICSHAIAVNLSEPNDSVNPILIFVGDYIDRGPNSKGVVDFVRSLQSIDHDIFNHVIALKGNHEDLLVESKNDRYAMETFLYNGGVSTLDSFGYTGGHNDIVEAVGKPIYNWMKQLPTYYAIGKVAISHAGIDDEDFTCDQHTPEQLIWSRQLRKHPHKIYDYTIHGHTPMHDAYVGPNVAYIDTGAVFGGKLTALYIKDVDNPHLYEKELIQV